MEDAEKLKGENVSLLTRYGDEITKAYRRAVREALLKHKLAGNPVAVARDGKVIWLQPDEILIDEDPDK